MGDGRSQLGDPQRLAGEDHRPGKRQAAGAHEHSIPVDAQHQLRGMQARFPRLIGNEERHGAVFRQAAILLKAGEEAEDVFFAGLHGG